MTAAKLNAAAAREYWRDALNNVDRGAVGFGTVSSPATQLSSDTQARWIFVGVVAFAGVVLTYSIVRFPLAVFMPQWPNLPSDISATWKWIGSQAQSFLALAAIATTVGLPFAVIAAFGVRNQAYLQRKIAQEQSSRECLFRFTQEWNGEITKNREDNTSHLSRARKALKKESWRHDADAAGFTGETDDDVTEVLNFFDKVAYLRRRGDLDCDLAWDTFGNTPVGFQEDSKEFVLAYRLGLVRRSSTESKAGELDMSYWLNFDWWVKELGPYDLRKIEEANKEYLRKKAEEERQENKKAEAERKKAESERKTAEKEDRIKAEHGRKKDEGPRS